jgi:hypothetical protein
MQLWLRSQPLFIKQLAGYGGIDEKDIYKAMETMKEPQLTAM